MANETFTQLPPVSSSTLNDIIAAVQSNQSVQQTLQQVFDLVLANMILSYAGNPNGNVAGVQYQLCWDTTDKELFICTTSGNAATAVWTSFSTSIDIPVPLSQGGTGASLTAAPGAIPYSAASTMEFLSPTSTANQLLISGANSAPSWSTSTFSSTYAASSLLYSNGANTVQGLTTQNSSVLFTSNSGVPTWSSSLTDGQVLIGSTGLNPVPATLTAGANITITNTAGAITIEGTGPSPGFEWTDVTGTTQTMASNNGYVADNSSLVTFTLPSTSNFGDEMKVIGKGAGGWKIVFNTGQTIILGNKECTTTTGNLASTNANDSVYLLCTTANTVWTVSTGTQGNLDVN